MKSKLIEFLPAKWIDFLGRNETSQMLEAIEKKIFSQTQIIYPSKENIFHAFNLVSPEKVKIVILGQDPYHGEGEAMGLSFSVPEKCKIPPSLKNIYKELENSLGIKNNHGDLTQWAQQGVFLLNSILTVKKDTPASHQKLGWEEFTDLVIQRISDKSERVIFLLWGKYAQSKKHLISAKHLILESVHPSPFSARLGFFGCDHFKKSNLELKKMNKSEIDWQLSD